MAHTILVVDDETILVDTIAYNLEQADYQVVTAADCVSVLEAARGEAPDLIYFVHNRGTVLTRDQILHHVWGHDYAGDVRTVDVHVR